MKYRELARRCANALREAIDTGSEVMEEAISGIIESLEAGPFKPGDEVDSSAYSRQVDSIFGPRAIVRTCWLNEETGVYWAAVEDGMHNIATANSSWFKKL